MVVSIANFPIFQIPLVVLTGFLTLFALFFTASIGYTTVRGIRWAPFKYHPIMAKITVILALIHGLLGLSIYLNF